MARINKTYYLSARINERMQIRHTKIRTKSILLWVRKSDIDMLFSSIFIFSYNVPDTFIGTGAYYFHLFFGDNRHGSIRSSSFVKKFKSLWCFCIIPFPVKINRVFSLFLRQIVWINTTSKGWQFKRMIGARAGSSSG